MCPPRPSPPPRARSARLAAVSLLTLPLCPRNAGRRLIGEAFDESRAFGYGLRMTPILSKPPWVEPRIKAAPKIRQIYWCDYWQDARLPEMWKTRPVVVISYKNTLRGPCLVVPLSTEPQDANRWAHRLSIEIEGDGVTSWAVCNHLTTVSTSRFSQFHGKIPVLPKADFNQVLEKLTEWLPDPFSI